MSNILLSFNLDDREKNSPHSTLKSLLQIVIKGNFGTYIYSHTSIVLRYGNGDWDRDEDGDKSDWDGIIMDEDGEIGMEIGFGDEYGEIRMGIIDGENRWGWNGNGDGYRMGIAGCIMDHGENS